MKFAPDIFADFIRPRNVVEKPTTAVEFLRAVESHGLKSVVISVSQEEEFGSGPSRSRTWFNYYNLYEAWDESDKKRPKISYKERYQDARIEFVDGNPANERYRQNLEWACIATARNRVRMMDENIHWKIKGSDVSYTNDKLECLDLILRDKKAQPLIVINQ